MHLEDLIQSGAIQYPGRLHILIALKIDQCGEKRIIVLRIAVAKVLKAGANAIDIFHGKKPSELELVFLPGFEYQNRGPRIRRKPVLDLAFIIRFPFDLGPVVDPQYICDAGSRVALMLQAEP